MGGAKMTDQLIEWMKENKIPVTRENYISCNWSPVPSPWTAELEDELPDELQVQNQPGPPKGGGSIWGRTFAQWAALFATMDIARIDNAIRSGLIGGLTSTEIARKVIGSAGINGIDGVTEITRKQMTNIGRAEIKALKLSGK